MSSPAHLCWLYEQQDDFNRAAVEFLAEGVRRSERIFYVADRHDTTEMARELAPLGDVDRRLAEGSLVLVPVHQLYEPGGRFDHDSQLARYRQLTSDAVSQGYSGLRVAADATALVASPQSRRQFAGYEFAVGALMHEVPFSAMCAYDATALAEGAMELCAVHPLRHVPDPFDPGFAVFHEGGRVKVTGELDLVNDALVQTALGFVADQAGSDLVVDLSDLEFVDVGGMRRLNHFAELLASRATTLRVHGARPILKRCCELLDNHAMLSAMTERAA